MADDRLSLMLERHDSRLWIGIFLVPILLLFGLFFLYPLIFVFAVSLTEWNGVSPPVFVGLRNYIDNFGADNFRLAVRNNLVWALALGGIQIGLALLVALILARRPRGWRLWRTIYFMPSVISKVAIASLWLALYNAEFGVINSILERIGLSGLTRNWLGEIETALPAIILQELVYIGYFMIIILAGTLAIPSTYYEAAEIDGANVWQQERFITLPLLRGILVTAIILATAFGLRHFEATFLMTRGGPANRTVVMGLLLYREWGALDYGHANAISATLVLLGGLLIAAIRWFFSRRADVGDATQ